jgi:hypothetical protein
VNQPLTLREITLGEWGKYAIVLPARTDEDAVLTARLLFGFFNAGPFYETQPLPPPAGSARPAPQIRNPERVIGYLAKLYDALTFAGGPDRRVFAREFQILEDQIDHLRRDGYGKLNVNLRLHDTLVAVRRQPRQVIAAGWVRRLPANPPEAAQRLRDAQTRKAANLLSARPTPRTPEAAKALRTQWQQLKTERAHAQPLAAPPPPRPEPKTQRTYFDRLAERAREKPAPLPSREQNNGPEPT